MLGSNDSGSACHTGVYRPEGSVSDASFTTEMSSYSLLYPCSVLHWINDEDAVSKLNQSYK